MPGNGTNIYQTARLAAGLTQEQAAELLDASVESVKAYETGQRLPPGARVAAMADVYGSPGLRLQHARATDELGVLPEAEAPLVLSRVTVTLVRTMLEWAEEHAGLALLKIAEDDRIDADERPIFDGIVCKLEGIAAAWLALRHLPPGIKRERPEDGASERSGLRRAENHCKSIITGSGADCKDFRREGGEKS